MTSSSPIIILSSSPDPRMVANRAAAASRVKSSATPSPKPHRHRPQALRIYSTLDARLRFGHVLHDNIFADLIPSTPEMPARNAPSPHSPTASTMDVDVVRRGKRESSPEWGSPIQPTSFQLDEAEEYDSPPHDSDLDLTSLPGEDCDDDEEVSEDRSEDEAILTQTTASDEGADAHQEVAKLWGDPDGDWAPADEESLADDENDEDDKSLEEEPEDVIVEDPGDDVLDGVFPDLLQQEEGDDLFIVIEGALLNDLLAEGATADEPIIIEDDYQVQESAITRAIVCTWTHYDHTEVPLQPWTHEDAGPSHAGHRSYACRRLNHGEVQIRHASGQWIPSWRARLNRPALPPVCDDCDPQVESAV
ncbi:unnamed protein product [Tilletia controversa]|nr:unnamed protein product [Tilletia controversa]CAD7066703.1 unnamed protein product [Tilletia caries]